MHEVALTESIVATISARLGTAHVVRVRIEIGRLVAVEPEAMRFAFAVCTEGTSLSEARLEIVDVAARGRCRTCEREGPLDGPVLLCPCGSADVELLSGNELHIKEVEVA
jgi:hydrogenase nickel incorporation protein HypA/HybF